MSIETEWMLDAACRGTPIGPFFPDEFKTPAPLVCQGCVVSALCLLYGAMRDEHGIWGGLSIRERTALKRKLSRAKARDLFWRKLREWEVGLAVRTEDLLNEGRVA